MGDDIGWEIDGGEQTHLCDDDCATERQEMARGGMGAMQGQTDR